MERRTLLKSGAVAIGVLGGGASAGVLASAGAASAAADTAQLPDQVAGAIRHMLAAIPKDFDPEYVRHAVVPFFLTSFYVGERPVLPMIDVTLTKENAMPFDFWGLIYRDWRPTPAEGVTVFLQGLENRGENFSSLWSHP